MEASYAVLWEDAGAEPFAGRLSLGPHSLTLHGGERGAEARREILYRDITGVRRVSERIGPLRAIALDSGSLGTVLLATVGLSHRGELFAELQRIVAAQA